MTRTLRPLAVLAVAAMIAFISAGCGGTDSSGGTTTAAPARTGATSTAAGHTSTASPHERAVKFAACMRENGYPDFPDPKASGEFASFGISVTPEVWVNALRACKELQPPGSFNPHMSPEVLSAARKFAKCIRAHGVKDFPDPVQDEPIVDTTKIPSTDTPEGMTILNAAMYKCRAFGPGPDSDNGTGG
jgi:hypothetical protein